VAVVVPVVTMALAEAIMTAAMAAPVATAALAAAVVLAAVPRVDQAVDPRVRTAMLAQDSLFQAGASPAVAVAISR